MTRRSASHDYSRPGIYHITIHVAEGLQQPLGTITGDEAATASVALTPVGAMVEHELMTAITAHYPVVTVDAHVVMPEHLHFILCVSDDIVTRSGHPTHLGQVIAGFKKGCNKAYWAAIGATGTPYPAAPAAATPAAATTPLAAGATNTIAAGTTNTIAAGKPQRTVPGGSPAGTEPGPAPAAPASRPPSDGTSGRAPLFAPGYCDVMPIEPGQLETQRAYIHDNPRCRWLRTHDRERLQPRRGTISAAMTPAALRGYLLRECLPASATPAVLAEIERRLLLADGRIVCDSYGDHTLLQQRLLPVVCHRKDASRQREQHQRCLDEAARGAVLVSPRIAKGEQAIIDDAVAHGFPVILIADNGFADRYHPSADRLTLCAGGRLLMVTPWCYEYRSKDDAITVAFCKTMNCVAQALCRLKDDWWQSPLE